MEEEGDNGEGWCCVQLLRRASLASGPAKSTANVRLSWLTGAGGDWSVKASAVRQGTEKGI